MAYEHLTPQRFCVTTTILHGQPGPAILQFCQRHHTRLLVAGNKGRSARADHWIGSVARYVEEHAVCPVVLLPINHDGSL
jgi:nucleotide-binding universal stress UspA family protein